jgi:MFS family permease
VSNAHSLTKKKKVYDSAFWLLCLSSLLFFASFNMIIPELPAYLTQLGGAEYKGLIISLFTITAMISRPFSGKLADTVGRVPVMIFGAVVCLICSLLYPVVSSLFAFFLLRFVHGFSTGFTPTGNTAYLSDIIPIEKRGEAMGLLGTAGAVGMAAGPAIGGTLANQFGLNAMFYCSSFFALVSIIILLGTKETVKQKQSFSLHHLKVNRTDLFEPLVLVPCLVMLLAAFSYGTVFTIIPDFGQFVGIKNKGLLFTYLTIASLLVRLIAGKASDQYGRVPVLLVSTIGIVISMLVIGTAESSLQLIIGVSIYGLAQGSTSPTLLAWATDLSHDQFKGRGIASLYIFMEMGIGLGAFISGWVYANDPLRFFLVLLMSGILAMIAFFYLLLKRRLSPV